ncbi:MAG: NADH:ubiquinone oxidoreductase subunit NDUFA12 [Hyphomicrobiales bacterium]|nr:NADH:ubiquinone oxidoreductase subunit NDUFA12 [Hyphomicrobiales bacterium]
MSLFTRFFTWWQGQNWNTQFYTWRTGEVVGDDEFGNRYYRTRGGKIDPALGFERRWVIFNGETEASAVPPGWFGWLNHTTDTPPTVEKYVAREWELPFQPNMTGTPQAWRPLGSTLRAGARPPATGDYEAWTPGA